MSKESDGEIGGFGLRLHLIRPFRLPQRRQGGCVGDRHDGESSGWELLGGEEGEDEGGGQPPAHVALNVPISPSLSFLHLLHHSWYLAPATHRISLRPSTTRSHLPLNSARQHVRALHLPRQCRQRQNGTHREYRREGGLTPKGKRSMPADYLGDDKPAKVPRGIASRAQSQGVSPAAATDDTIGE